ncbi:MAG: hypothetical protein J1F32_00780 [Erysipelotrichales bacterium]|nr:hypothetical protein [Erysipelotrichales bacterium]
MSKIEYNEYIKNYYDNSKIAGALMLKSSWGRGKSYYIDNDLIPTIGNENCIKVSLYGLKYIEDISKAIYLDTITKKFHLKKIKKMSLPFFLGKTILRGVLSFWKINVKSEEKELLQLYKSADLSKKLIILEDVERSSIPINDVLGYVNNLCEQDNLKVLLVANEEAILSGANGKDKIDNYYKIKEKTIIDTIVFDSDIEDPITNILGFFAKTDNSFKELIKRKGKNEQIIAVNKISAIMRKDDKIHKGNGYNLRSLIFACQKTEDFFNKVRDNSISFSQDFFESCLYGIIAFSLKLKRGSYHDDEISLKWTSDLDSPTFLGQENHRLLRVCFDFIQEQKFNVGNVKKTIEDYSKHEIKHESWWKLNRFDSYHFDELIKAIENINKLTDEDFISFEEYGLLSCALFKIKDRIGDVNQIGPLIELIKTKLEQGDFYPYMVYDKIVNPPNNIKFSNKSTQKEYENFNGEIADIIVKKAIEDILMSIEIIGDNNINEFMLLVNQYVKNGTNNNLLDSIKIGLVDKLNIKDLIDNLANCSPRTISKFCEAFLKIYNEKIEVNREIIKELESKISNQGIDIIIKYQLSSFEDKLKKNI